MGIQAIAVYQYDNDQYYLKVKSQANDDDCVGNRVVIFFPANIERIISWAYR